MGLMGRLSILAIGSTVGLGLLVLSLFFTSPTVIGPVGVTVWFVVFYLTLAGWLSLLLYVVKLYLHLHSASVQRLRYSFRQGMLIGALLTGVLALSSLKQLSLLDVILLGLILVIIEVYMRFRWP